MHEHERFMDLSDAAVFLRLGRSRLYELFEAGKISGREVDGKILFKVSDLEREIVPRITRTKKGQR
jgi:hypothetical protein